MVEILGGVFQLLVELEKMVHLEVVEHHHRVDQESLEVVEIHLQ